MGFDLVPFSGPPGKAQKDNAVLVQFTDLRHEALTMEISGFSTLEIALAVGIVAALLVILLLVRKLQTNSAKIQRLEDQERGLQHSLMADQKNATKDATKLEALQSTLAKEQGRLEADCIEFRALDAVSKAEIDDALRRGKVTMDETRQTFACLETIKFYDSVVTKNAADLPPPEFENKEAALWVIADLALLLTYIKGAVVLVEGHTSGGQSAMSDIGFAKATQRAQKVVDELMGLGIKKERLEFRGCPGWCGDNRDDIKIITLAWGY